MATAEQIAANRRNAQKSTGPRSKPGKDVTRFNGLTHGLRAVHVIIPGEDPAEFQAHRDAMFGDWKPLSHTRALLVERAVVASWKLRRATHAEAVRLYEPAADAAHEFDMAQRERVEGGLNLLRYEPGTALARLRCDPVGIDRLIALWEGLAEAVAEPSGWTSRADHHDRLLNLLGHTAGSAPEGLEAARASLALLAADDPAATAEAAATLRATCAERIAELRRERSGFWDPAVLRKRTIDAAAAPLSREAQLMHRYEVAHEKSLYAAIRGLLTLEKSGADLPDPEPEAPPAEAAAPPAAPEAVAAALAGPGAPEESGTTNDTEKTSGKLASVGAAPSPGVRSGTSATPRPPRRDPSGPDPDPGSAPDRL